MATYALTFATRAAFDTSLASGDIYNLMQGVTSSKPSVAITATITESGETYACGTNVMVDIKSVGPGDYVMYDSTNNKFFGIASKWIDNNYPAQPTQHIMIFKEGVLPARFVVCGSVIKRFGNRIRMAGINTWLAWSSENQTDYAWGVPTIPSYTGIVKKDGTTANLFNIYAWCAFPSLRYQESSFPGGDASYLPITRSTWDAAVAAGNTTVTQNGKTATLADYDNSYDKWLAANWSPKFPAASGCYSDTDGFGNTQKIVANFIANHSKTAASVDYAAGYCYNFTPSDSVPGLEKGKWFLGAVKDVGEIRSLSHTLIPALAWGASLLLSSSQYSSAYAWCVDQKGYTSSIRKYTRRPCIPIADLIIEN
jgi:hypothetical protein